MHCRQAFLLAILIAAARPAASAGIDSPQKILTIEDIYADTLLTGRLPSSIRWIPNSSGISFLEKTGADSTEQTSFIIAAVPSGDRLTVCITDTITVPSDLKKTDKDKIKMSGYIWSKTSDKVAFGFKGDIFSLNPDDGSIERLTQTEALEKNFSFSPDGAMLAFSRDHDLYALDLLSNDEIRFTSTGNDSLLNGVLDWVYMEELFTRGNTFAYWWSPDSRLIAFLEFTESPVCTYPIVGYNELHGSLEMQRYPKAGDPNPDVRIGVYNIEKGETTWLMSTHDDDSYIARVHWLEDSKRLAVEKLNRQQTRLDLLIFDARSGSSNTIISDSDSTWVNINYMKYFYKKRDRFIWTSEKDGFAHLYSYDFNGNGRKLVEGPFVVSALNGVNEKKGEIYFTALKASVLERHLYEVAARSRRVKQLTKTAGTHSIKMSPDCRYYIDTFSNSFTPPTISLHDSKGRLRFIIGKSKKETLASYSLPKKEYYTFSSKKGITYNCSIIKPPGFDPSAKYPVIIYVYGGPHAQVVRNSWGGARYLWHAMMASRGFIIFSMDNRGSYGRGKAWENAISRRAGIIELHDQLAGVDHLKSLPYVDSNRMGIWGWSYGGFMTCAALLKTPGVFKAGAAVAPVTDWRLYDSIYTERYMGRPDENEEGYDETSVLSCADSLQSAFLLVHGIADNNVHMQNSIRLIKKLVEAGKEFDVMFYPDKRHGIKGNKARRHLFKKITKFFEEQLL